MEQPQSTATYAPSTPAFFGRVLLSGWLLALPFCIPALFIGLHLEVANQLIICAVLAVGGGLGGIFASQAKRMPAAFCTRYAIAAAPLAVCVVLCALPMVLSGGNTSSLLFLPYAFSQLSFFPVLIYAGLTASTPLLFLFPLAFYVVFLLSFAFFERRRADAPAVQKRPLLLALGLFAALLALLGGTYLAARRTLLPRSYGYEHGGGYSSVSLWEYDVTNAENLLPRLSDPSTFTVESPADMPVLDGAEAAYPVYSAFANACYRDIAAYEKSQGGVISFTNTIYAYERLLSGEVDIFFGAQPSAAQRKMAEEAGKELVLTPIGLEAFVFFVSTENPLDSLTSEQIRAVYSGATKNWAELGGPDARIYAFQRPENSGSQTIMERFMGNTPLREPLEEEYSPGMGGTVRRVAEYRNAAESLGYSFRFFLTGMADSSGVKMLALDGISPTTQNISSRAYPYTVELYAVTLADNQNENTAPFLAWMQAPQGQELVAASGYVPLP